ncbi:MAG TPA: histidine kinase [Ginsengibacter sp.]|nr:histidine kinase [Ginsengibacter sp.]HRP43833.1 histidine kinase [Ginsengibacter sp.]
MKNTLMKYWLCQILGWGGWMVWNLAFVFFFTFTPDFYFKGERKIYFLLGLLVQFVWFILATHSLRAVLKKIKWIEFPTNKIIVVFVVGVLATGLVGYYGARFTVQATGASLSQYEKREGKKVAIEMEKKQGLTGDYYAHFNQPITDSTNYKKALRIKMNTGWYRDTKGAWKYQNFLGGRFWWDLAFSFILVALWLSIYIVWHYLLRNQKAELDKLELEKTVKELELKTIKSHINPHFIFNSLNSIRALVEENPGRARTAITELSNILRSSLHMEKMETVSLEKELNIVKDYLALEQMRFEERLKVNFDIQESTLDSPVPPMMLQTLVENAIKHGISKRIEGGIINIISTFKEDTLVILVQNSGRIEADGNEGFGLASTRNRLKILYGDKAGFVVSNLDDEMVQAKIVLPAYK